MIMFHLRPPYQHPGWQPSGWLESDCEVLKSIIVAGNYIAFIYINYRGKHCCGASRASSSAGPSTDSWNSRSGIKEIQGNLVKIRILNIWFSSVRRPYLLGKSSYAEIIVCSKYLRSTSLVGRLLSAAQYTSRWICWAAHMNSLRAHH